MIKADIFTENGGHIVKQFDDITAAEQYAMKVLGVLTVAGVISLVRVTDTMLAEISEYEF